MGRESKTVRINRTQMIEVRVEAKLDAYTLFLVGCLL
jgi:hypothetical protein